MNLIDKLREADGIFCPNESSTQGMLLALRQTRLIGQKKFVGFELPGKTLGVMGYKTPNIDRLAKEGALFTDFYAQQSCTAGHASFILGQHPFRTGLLTIGMPGSPHGIPDWSPTIADLRRCLAQ